MDAAKGFEALRRDLIVVETLAHLFHSLNVGAYGAGMVRVLSSVSTTKTASSFAGSVALALRLTRWLEPGVSYQLSPAW